MALAWKAGWVNALAGSNPASSAAITSTNAIRTGRGPDAHRRGVEDQPITDMTTRSGTPRGSRTVAEDDHPPSRTLNLRRATADQPWTARRLPLIVPTKETRQS